MSRRGLPESISMRHDEHYVEALAASAGTPVGRVVPIDLIDPNPNQPRQVMGDLSDLIASIGEKGFIEALIVRQRGERFQIIAGERRYQASVQAGLRELPVVVRDVDDTEVIELALIENLQRKDLTPFEEAEADAVQRKAPHGTCGASPAPRWRDFPPDHTHIFVFARALHFILLLVGSAMLGDDEFESGLEVTTRMEMRTAADDGGPGPAVVQRHAAVPSGWRDHAAANGRFAAGGRRPAARRSNSLESQARQ